MKKILILRLSSLGDIVLTEPIAARLRKAFPNAVIDYLTKPTFVQLVEAFQAIDNIHLWQDKQSILKKLKKQKYDLVIDLHSKINTFIIKKYLNSPKTFSYRKRHFGRWLLTKHLSKKPIESTVLLYFTALEKLSIDKEYSIPKLIPTIKSHQSFENLKSFKKIGIFPGALHKTKQYPIEKLADVINNTPVNWNCRYFILGSEKEKKLADKLVSISNNKAQNLCGKFDISELISVISNLDIIISNDSGPMHIAAALSKPQIAIFGATHPILGFAPLNINATVLSADINCQPCSLHGTKKCKKKDFRCMQLISSKEILKIIKIKIS